MQPMHAWLRGALNSLGNDTAQLKGKWIGLYTALSAPVGPNLTLPNVTEANYSGYARQQVGTWNPAILGTDGLDEIIAPLLTFTPSDTVTANTVLGALYADASIAGNLNFLDPFSAPVYLTGPTTALNYVPRFGFDPSANYDTGVVIN